MKIKPMLHVDIREFMLKIHEVHISMKYINFVMIKNIFFEVKGLRNKLLVGNCLRNSEADVFSFSVFIQVLMVFDSMYI